MSKYRPATVAEALSLIAAWLDLPAEKRSATKNSGTEIQDDLRAWATWLYYHPEVDAQMRSTTAQK